MQKIIVTHTNPDLDAVGAVWVVKRFWKGWKGAEVEFVPAGEVLHSTGNKEVIHVDTGYGEFDHHQTSADTCASVLAWEKIKDEHRRSSSVVDAMERLTGQINEFDHFRNVYYPNASADYHDFSLVHVLDGLNLLYNEKGNGDVQVVEFGMTALDAVLKTLVQKVRAEKEIEQTASAAFDSLFGKVLAFEIGNDSVIKVAQRMGYTMVVRKDPKKGYLRIKALPDKGIDLTNLYEALKKADPDATWYLHPSKTMLLNGTTKNPAMRPTKLTLEEVMEVVKGVK